MTPDLLPEKLAARIVVDESGCWMWQGAKTSRGYGMASLSGWRASRQTHRIAYTLLVGEIPAGLHLDHLCRVPGCCNPEHLEPVTALENNRRAPGWLGNRTHCKKGHPYAGDNLFLTPEGYRRCRACARVASAEQAAKRKEWRKANPYVRTICGNGLHPWPESMHVTPSGTRQCIECRRASRRRYKAAKRTT